MGNDEYIDMNVENMLKAFKKAEEWKDPQEERELNHKLLALRDKLFRDYDISFACFELLCDCYKIKTPIVYKEPAHFFI